MHNACRVAAQVIMGTLKKAATSLSSLIFFPPSHCLLFPSFPHCPFVPKVTTLLSAAIMWSFFVLLVFLCIAKHSADVVAMHRSTLNSILFSSSSSHHVLGILGSLWGLSGCSWGVGRIGRVESASSEFDGTSLRLSGLYFLSSFFFVFYLCRAGEVARWPWFVGGVGSRRRVDHLPRPLLIICAGGLSVRG